MLAVGGWADPCRGAVFRRLDELTPLGALVKGRPWAHIYPHQAAPGPAMDFIGECLK